MKTFKKLLFLLSSHQRKHLGLLLIMITIMALLDMIGVASILPFMAVLTNQGASVADFVHEFRKQDPQLRNANVFFFK